MTLPIEALQQIKPKLRSDDLTILEYLSKENANSTQYSFSKDYIQKELELTSARTANALIRLEVACLIDRQAFQKPQKFYITDSGYEMLKLF
jgi:RIO-like serine/threonine protein kinase